MPGLILSPIGTCLLSGECLTRSSSSPRNNAASSSWVRSTALYFPWPVLRRFVCFSPFGTQRCCSRRSISTECHKSVGIARPTCTWTLRRARPCRYFFPKLPTPNRQEVILLKRLQMCSFRIAVSFWYKWTSNWPIWMLRFRQWEGCRPSIRPDPQSLALLLVPMRCWDWLPSPRVFGKYESSCGRVRLRYTGWEPAWTLRVPQMKLGVANKKKRLDRESTLRLWLSH